MATLTTTDLQKIEDTPEAQKARRLMESIERKLNYDGRYSVLTRFETGSRFAKLTNEELEYLGRLNGWDEPYYNHIDWEAVPDNFLAACIEIDHGMRALQSLYPSPDIKPVIDAANKKNPDDITDFLQGFLTLGDLQAKYSEATL